MRRLSIVFAIVLMPVAAAAQPQNVTVRDIIELSRANLGEEALLALIEVNRPVFPVDVATLKALKEAGVPPSVITAMIRSGRPAPQVPAEEPALPAAGIPPQVAPAPPVVVVEHREEPRVREVAVPVPVYVAVPVRRVHPDDGHVRPPRSTKPAEPVYWGWGGKLRPDAWKPAIESQKDARIEVQKK
jgi:hypothetical protein